MSTTTRHRVTADHLRRLATVDKRSLFADATTLIDTEDGVLQVPFRVVEAALDGRSKLACCRLLYDRSQLIEDGVLAGTRPRTVDGGDLGVRLGVIANGINDDTPDLKENER